MEAISSIEQLTPESISRLTESEVYDVLCKVLRPLNPDKRKTFMDLMRTYFDFRSIHLSRRNLKKDMERYGYVFCKISEKDEMIMGIKRK